MTEVMANNEIIERVQKEAIDENVIYTEIREPYGFIYITTNLINGKRYLGQKEFVQKNWKSYLGSGTAFKKAVKLYGKENFRRDIIYICYSKEELNQMEYELSVFFDVVDSDDWYNLIFGGSGTNGWKHSEEAKKKMSEAKKEAYVGDGNPFYGKEHSYKTKQHLSDVRKGKNVGKDNPNYGKHLSDETKAKIGQGNKGKIISLETREKISVALTGKMAGENHPMFGKHLSDEWKEKISKANSGENHWQFGKHVSEETKQKLREANSGENSAWYGKNHSEETKQKISNSKTGCTVSGSTRLKISIAAKERYKDPKNTPMYGKHISEETKEKVRNTRKNNMIGYKMVFCHELTSLFCSIKEAGELLHLDPSAISKCCKTKVKYCGKHPITNEPLHWLYVYDQTEKDGTIIQGAITLGYITEEQVNEYLNNLRQKGND